MKNAGNGNASKDIEIVMQVTENSGIRKMQENTKPNLNLNSNLKN